MTKTNVDEFLDNKTRNIYNSKVDNKSLDKKYGLTEEIIREISNEKNEPEWVLNIRLKALEWFYKLDNPGDQILVI